MHVSQRSNGNLFSQNENGLLVGKIDTWIQEFGLQLTFLDVSCHVSFTVKYVPLPMLSPRIPFAL